VAVDTFDAGSPFDFENQGLFFVPPLPVPSGKDVGVWRTQSNATVGEVLRKSNGSALLTFTSRTEMEESYRILAPQIRKAGHQALKQGDASNKVLAREFDADEHSVLFGLASFMTGVDFQGDTCRFVWINKLPFLVPTDVVPAARMALLDKKYGQWSKQGGFNGIAVPHMALILLQAIGRGIRTVNDYCVIGCGDSRLYGKNAKPYGSKLSKDIRQAHPGLPITQSLDDVEEFYRLHERVSA
jgi:ATP-dependent DNA helicase DinG